MKRLMRIAAALIMAQGLLGNPVSATEDLPREVTLNGVEFVLIPAGWFTMTVENGQRFTDTSEDEPLYRPVKVWLDSFYLAKYEATARDLVRFLNAPDVPEAIKQEHTRLWREGGEAEKRTGIGCTVHQDADGRFTPAQPDQNYPATYISWRLANEFAEWLGFRLPTSAEWQKAARGPHDDRAWPWGSIYPDDTYALFSIGVYCTPAPVDAYPRGRSPYGIYNMAGNVSEHVVDWYDHEHDASLSDGVRNPVSLMAPEAEPVKIRGRIRYGGSWSSDPHSFLIPYRRLTWPERAPNRYGVRFAVDSVVMKSAIDAGKSVVIELTTTPRIGE